MLINCSSLVVVSLIMIQFIRNRLVIFSPNSTSSSEVHRNNKDGLSAHSIGMFFILLLLDIIL